MADPTATPERMEATARAYAHHNPRCLGCGEDNVMSLGFRIAVDPSAAEWVASVTFADGHEGGVGFVHGGMLGLALDEGLGRAACIRRAAHCVTARLEVDFRAPARPGAYALHVREEGREGRKTWMVGELSRDGVVHAVGRGLFVVVAPALGG